jgi:hypothetical protein
LQVRQMFHLGCQYKTINLTLKTKILTIIGRMHVYSKRQTKTCHINTNISSDYTFELREDFRNQYQSILINKSTAWQVQTS